MLLSLTGGGVGLLLAAWINHFVGAIKLPMDIALVFDLRIDWRVLIFTLLVSLVTGILFSLLPALQSSKPELVPALKDESSMAGFRRSRLRNSLVISQIALSLVLLVSAGLIVRSLQAAQRMRPGFNPQNAVSISFDLGLQGYDDVKGRTFFQRALERVRAIPGVRSVAFIDTLPLALDYSSTSIYVEGQPLTSKSKWPQAIPYSVSPGYFETMGIPLRGRDFLPNENTKESRVAIVNETFARKFFKGDAIGKRYNSSGPNDPYFQIIGVVPDGKYNTLGEEPKAVTFRPIRYFDSTCNLVARTEGDPRTVLAAIRREAATDRSGAAALRCENADRAHEHSAFPGEDRGGRARKFRCARARACRRRNLRRDVVHGRWTNARDRFAHGARRAIAQRRPDSF